MSMSNYIFVMVVTLLALACTGWQILKTIRAEDKVRGMKKRLQQLKEQMGPVEGAPDFFVSFKKHPDIQNIGEVSHNENRARAKARELQAKAKCRVTLVRYRAIERMRGLRRDLD